MPVISKITGAPFRFWCQKILPAVYDDSLSYYELLCKVVDYLNKVMEDDINVINLVNELEEFVNNYFNNLDVQEEINNKLDAMAEDGSLLAAIEPYLQPVVDQLHEDYSDFTEEVNTQIEQYNAAMEAELADHIEDVQNSLSDMRTDISEQDNDISLMQTQMNNFIDSYSDIQTFTTLFESTEQNGGHYEGQTITLLDAYTDYTELDIYWSFLGDVRVTRVASADVLANGVVISWFADSPALQPSNPAPLNIPLMSLINGNNDHTALTISTAYAETWTGLSTDSAVRNAATTSTDYDAGSIIRIIGVEYQASAELTDIRVAANGAVYPTAGDAVRAQVNALNVAIANKPSDVPYIENSQIANASKTGTVFIINEKEPINFKNITGSTGTVHSRNRFDLEDAEFTMSGYASSYTITKENNGIKIACRLENTTSSHYAYVDYTAEFTGKLYLSCETELISGNIVCASMIMKKNGVTVEQTFGEGLNYIATDVVAGDTIRIGFYGHIMDGVGSTVAYKNIMLSYGGLYPFDTYKNDATTGRSTNVTEDYVLADYISSGNYSSSFKWVLLSGALSDMYELPPDNNTLPEDVEIICDENVPLIAYNALSADSTLTGIGIGRTGSIGFRINGLNKTAMTAWLAEHPLTIRYKTGETYQGSEILNDRFQRGIIITYPTDQTIKYQYTKDEKNKKLLCFGDSITGMFAGGADYPTMVEMSSDIGTINCGFAGTGYCDHASADYLPFSANRLIEAVVNNDYTLQDASSLVDPTSPNYDEQYYEHLQNLKTTDFTSVQYVSFFYGTNDWGSNKPLYSADDESTENKQRTNVEDAVKYCIENLARKYPHLKILVVTPYWRTTATYPDSNVDPNTLGIYLYEYADGIKDFASNTFNIPVLNLYRSFGANVITNRYFTKDGTHPNENGKWIIANRIIKLVSEY